MVLFSVGIEAIAGAVPQAAMLGKTSTETGRTLAECALMAGIAGTVVVVDGVEL